MKNIFYLLVSFILVASCSSGPKDSSELDAAIIETDNNGAKEPKMQFKDDVMAWDFGTITEGERVEHTFKFTNVGNSDLVVSSATASCGCTIPSPPKEPIAPGESSEIKVEFNSAGKSDIVTKDITILANTNPVKTMLQIKVFVKKKAPNE
ncbi:MAG TPA: DUF1573 domain-containing protein [Bacteroidetes bacterium]|nr:DUF1573 domain-containing protein [Bacteroidota bacterium]